MDYGHVQGRPLAPRPLGPHPLLEPPPDENKKRKRAAIACKPCRERKSACNSVRPVCAACETRQTECYYLTKDESETRLQALRRENKTLNELIDHLRTMPDDEAHAVLQLVRNSANPQSILKNIRDGNLSMVQPSQRETALAALPLAHSETEFKLMVDHSAAYPALDLTRSAILAKTTLLESTRMLAHDLPPEKAASGSFAASSADPRELGDNPQDLLRAQAEPNIETDGGFPQSIDPLLDDLRIKYWSTVDVTDEFAASAICMYLENDHPTLGLFDAWLFLKDLIERKHECCSSFLVTSLLAFASQAYSSKDPDAASKSFEFEKEAEMLWRAEKKDSILTIAGLSLLFLSHGGHGSGREFEILHEASDMAKRLNLFGVKNVLDDAQISMLSPVAQRALAHTTWGVFNLHILQAQFYLALSTQYEPRVSIPKPPEDNESEVFANLKILRSHDAGRVFYHLCKLSVYASGIFLVVRDTTGSKTPPPLAFALQQFSQLLEFVDSLPNGMRRGAGADYAPVLDFHIFLHTLITDLFRPFITRPRDDGFREFYQKQNSPGAIFASSVHQLKGIIVEYTSQHPSAAHHLYWQTALLYVFNTIVKDQSDPQWPFYFWLCMHCYSKLFICYAAVEDFVQSLLAIAVRYGAISHKDATRVMQEGFYQDGKAKRVRLRREGQQQTQRSTYKLDLDLAVRDRDAADVSALIARFEDMDMFEEFTRIDESEEGEGASDFHK
ncbi:hypothetical protein PMIN06_002189 [Paraphaeosphaeria minitans]|uniref:N-terminal fungal transcription regulatory domain-containing protein (Zinc finger protein) n=1 Tax=Paraphaeosphaeria minitans TaxID=565426 RepID=A0A9P6GIY3_9PLEO|nr:N-terminal fungal transcription regulatory domain-containing protein (zinc finger protein) [Paraphaeosphaeria minitans]